MKLSVEEVEKIANLARLSLESEEKAKYAEQLSAILDYAKQLEEVDTAGVEPSAQVTGLENVLREDKVIEMDDSARKEMLEQAPATEDNLVKAKAVFE